MMTQGSLNCSKRQRERWLDAVKGWAILLVVMGHTQSIPVFQGVQTACYMQLFFVIAGYTFSVKKGSISKRLKRLLVPYFAWGCFYYLLYIVTSFCGDCLHLDQLYQKLLGIVYSRFSYYPLDSDYKIILFPSGAEPLWFLTCMALAICAAVPLIKAGKRLSIFLLVVYIGITLMFAYCPVLMPWSIDTVFIAAVFIYCGYRMKGNLLKRKYSSRLLISLMMLYAILAYINQGINMSVRDYGCIENYAIAIFLFFIIGLLGTIIYATCFKIIENTKLCAFFAYLGRISLTIMCAHMVLDYFFDIIVSPSEWEDSFVCRWIVIFPLRLIFIITCCVVFVKVYEYIMSHVSVFKNSRLATINHSAHPRD